MKTEFDSLINECGADLPREGKEEVSITLVEQVARDVQNLYIMADRLDHVTRR